MPRYYEKCSFDVDVIGKRTECDRFSCEGKQNLFCSFKKKNNESFYCLNRKQLEEYWKCVARHQETFCPDECNNYAVCKFFTQAYENLKDCYFFWPRKDTPYQPSFWQIFTVTDHKNEPVFRAEIRKTVKGTGRVYHGETC